MFEYVIGSDECIRSKLNVGTKFKMAAKRSRDPKNGLMCYISMSFNSYGHLKTTTQKCG